MMNESVGLARKADDSGPFQSVESSCAVWKFMPSRSDSSPGSKGITATGLVKNAKGPDSGGKNCVERLVIVSGYSSRLLQQLQ